jgi:hypothetical protein
MTLSEDKVEELFRRLQAIEDRPIYISDLKFGSFLGGVKVLAVLLVACVTFGWTTSILVGDITHQITSIDSRLMSVEYVISNIKAECLKKETLKNGHLR